jgi:hypothetical protein
MCFVLVQSNSVSLLRTACALCEQRFDRPEDATRTPSREPEEDDTYCRDLKRGPDPQSSTAAESWSTISGGRVACKIVPPSN